jgi:hypothetical protein
VDVNFDGIVIPDHVPELGVPPAGALAKSGTAEFRPSPGLAYSIGYLNATLKAVLSNKKRKA